MAKVSMQESIIDFYPDYFNSVQEVMMCSTYYIAMVISSL